MNLSYRSLLAIGCVAFSVLQQNGYAADKLPSESEIPGNWFLRSVDSTQPASLPPESALPGTSERPTPERPNAAQTKPHPPSQGGSRELPAESVLPIQLNSPNLNDPQLNNQPEQAAMDDRKGDANAPHQGAEDRRPWLTLRTQAPLGVTRCLTFTPDSQRVCVGGDDKSVHVYRNFKGLNGNRRWGFERTIRWQVQRGPRGRINAMDAAGNRLAIAGLSAMGEAGNIVFVDPATGQYGAVLTGDKVGHRERVTSLAFTGRDASGLASMDVTGKLIHWRRNSQTGSWIPRELASHDHWKLVENLRSIHPIAATQRSIFAPRFVGTTSRPVWEIVEYPVAGGAARALKNLRHNQLVTAMAVDEGAGLVATAGFEGEVILTLDGRPHRVNGLLPGNFAISLAFADNARRLVVTTTNGSATNGALQVFDITDPASPKMRHTGPLTGMPLVAVAPDGQQLAAADSTGVRLHPLNNLATNIATFQSSIPKIGSVGFSAKDGDYTIGISTGESNERLKVFDTTQLRMRTQPRSQQAWSRADAAQGGWTIETRAPAGQQDGRPRVVLAKNGITVSPVPLIPAHAHTSEFWIPGANGETVAVAIGTTGQNNIYVIDLSKGGQCKLMREFRGHTGAVRCLGLSTDGKYLVSGSDDHTVRIWPLDARKTKRSSQSDRWGATFSRIDNELTVDSVDAAGPLHLRGIRMGDVLTRLRVPRFAGNEVTVDDIVDSDAMLKILNTISADRLLGFEYRRGRTAQAPFQVFSAWPALASLFVSVDDEWAYWTPAGFYDASFEGHRMLGWQVNRGVTRAPDYFLAEQVRQSLERPELMERLLDAGNVEEAIRGAGLRVPANSQWALRERLRTAPEVTILSPTSGTTTGKSSLQVRVSVAAPAGQSILPPKLFANGVVARDRKLISESNSGGNRTQVYQWQASLPSDREITLQAFAATASEVVGRDSIDISNSRPPNRSPRLYVAAAAVGNYQDSQIPRLEAVVADTKRLLSTLKISARGVYELDDLPFFENVTRTGWNVAMDELAEQMQREASPDDLLVILLSGHGVRDELSDEYYYLPVDADFSEVMSRQYDKCISSSDLARFATVSCRKLVILDTCHSGAVRPLRQRQLKFALRALQDDMMFTLTASQGDQVAVQSRFAKRLDEALRGSADRQAGNGDGLVTLDELGQYVRTMVMADSAGDANVQIPSIGPRDLVQQVRIPVTSTTVLNAAILNESR